MNVRIHNLLVELEAARLTEIERLVNVDTTSSTSAADVRKLSRHSNGFDTMSRVSAMEVRTQP
ncbi:MAG: hypothetical protein WA864_14795 [Acetobacteraceae bacterium]